jgi:tetratricopeptide (TPR) repeat protein
MTKPLIFALIVFLFLTFTTARGFAQDGGQTAAAVVTPAEAGKWRADLSQLAEEMPRYHKNLFHTITPAQFALAVKNLHDKIPGLARHQIIVEMAKIVATIGDGHTNIAPTRDPKVAFSALPVKLYLFREGLFVRSAKREYAYLVGSRVVRIGGITADEAVEWAGEMIGKDNEMDVKFFAPHLLVMPEVLNALGLSAGVRSADFTIEKDGKQRVITLPASGPADLIPPDTDLTWLPKEGWADLRDGAKAPAPLWLKDPQNKFRYEYLPGPRTVYVQINQVGNKETETLADFTRRLFEFIDSSNAEKLVFDLRLNRGGNGTLLKPLLLAVIKSRLNRPGKLFAIMGRSTWSAAQFFLNDLEAYTDVTFVGEPSGSRGNIYGDSRKIILSNSGITARASVYYWQDWVPWDTRKWTAPHLTTELSAENYSSNTDPAMELILAGTPKPDLDALLRETSAQGGAAAAVKKYREFRAAPVNKFAATEDALLVTGQRFLDQNKPEQALELFKLVVEEYPGSFRAFFAVGEAYARTGNKELAIINFKKSLELYPNNYDVLMRLKEIAAPVTSIH